MIKEILTEKEAVIYIRMSRSFLSQDRMNGYREGRTPGPIFIKLGRSIRYHKHDLDTWLNQHRIIRTLNKAPSYRQISQILMADLFP